MKNAVLTKALTASVLLAVSLTPVWAQTLDIRPEKATGIYAPGEKLAWTVRVVGPNADKVTTATYQIKKGGATVVDKGTLDLSQSKTARIETMQPEGMTYFAEATATDADGKKITARGGAVISPEKIGPAMPRPADFDAFWKTQVARLNALPMTVELSPGDSGQAGVDYWKVTFQNINGKKVRAQMARPHDGAKFPGLLVLQAAGVYPLDKKGIVSRAASGWLVLNVNAHDLPIDSPAEFYTKAAETTHLNYAVQGSESRETSYLLPMVLGDVRAADYLASRPDWNGKTLVATGGSQGGFQSVATASLSPHITAVVVNVPAGGDTTGPLVGRAISWPRWLQNAPPDKKAAITETSRYFDTVHFASNVRVPTLVGMGLIDLSSAPAGVFALTNQLKGPKEVVVMPLAAHKQVGDSQAAYYERSRVWLAALRKGEPAPIAK